MAFKPTPEKPMRNLSMCCAGSIITRISLAATLLSFVPSVGIASPGHE